LFGSNLAIKKRDEALLSDTESSIQIQPYQSDCLPKWASETNFDFVAQVAQLRGSFQSALRPDATDDKAFSISRPQASKQRVGGSNPSGRAI